MNHTLTHRPRRLRQNPIIRNLVADVEVSLRHLIQPYFVTQAAGPAERHPISGFTDVFRYGVDALSVEIERDVESGVKSFLLFGDIESSLKDPIASRAYHEGTSVPEALRKLKSRFGPAAQFFTDVCLCAYSENGHCGIVREEEILNDVSLEALAKMAVCHAEAGADFVAPSDMMDGRVAYLRSALDRKGFQNVGILAYTAKFASSYYGPFREAVSSTPQGVTDRCSYQMDYRNSTEALRELALDLEEGADLVMVKPALPYLDVIKSIKDHSDVPVAAYSVSGEYEMVKQLAKLGMADEQKMAVENLHSIRRAGASIIVTYFATLAARKGWLPR
jgi:porphobilinogen synthase